MASTFPTAIDSFVTPTTSSPLNAPSHTAVHLLVHDALTAIEAKLGVNGSAVTTSVNYLLTNVASINPGHLHTLSTISDFPTIAGQSGKYLYTDGATVSWATVSAGVSSVFGRTGAVTAQTGDYTVAQVTGAAPLASPTFTGTPAAPTPSTADSSTKIATTAYVQAQGYLTSNAVTSVFGRTGAVTAQSGDYSITQITGFPSQTGNSGKFLTTDGSSLSWGTAAGTHTLLSSTHTDTVAASAVLGDLLYANATPAWTKLAGNTTTTRKFLRQTGTGSVSAAPAWDTLLTGDLPDLSGTYALVSHTHAHSALTGLTNDDHTQYALLAGRSGGQTLLGGTAASNTLTLQSTAHATKGKILFGASAYDEVNDRLGAGTATPRHTLHAAGSFGHKVVTKTANYTAADETVILCDASSGGFTISLPALSGVADRLLVLKKIDSSDHQIVIDPSGSETMDGLLTYTLATQYSTITLVAGSSEWSIL